MSVYIVYKQNGVKMMRPVLTREEYVKLRNSGFQRENVARIRQGDEALKASLVQMNYSCLPNADGTLKGSRTQSTTVGMDIDFKAPQGLSADEQPQWLAQQMAGVPSLVMGKREQLGLLMLERSATKGYHLVFRRRPELSQEDNLRWASQLLGVAYDNKAKDITRVFFTTTGDEGDLLFLDDEIFKMAEPAGNSEKAEKPEDAAKPEKAAKPEDAAKPEKAAKPEDAAQAAQAATARQYPSDYHGIPFADIIRKYWEMNNRGFEPTKGDRDTLTYQLACDLRHICGRNFEWLDQVIPCYDGFPLEEKRAKIKSALASELNGFPMRLRNVLNALQMEDGRCKMEDVDEPSDADDEQFSIVNSQFSIKRMPQGIRDSIEAVGPQLAMPVVTAVCPCIGMLATGVKMDVHGQQKGLNLIAYIAGDFASGKGSIDPVVGAWMSEVEALDEMYLTQEKEWRDRKVAAKNKKDQPEEPRLPVRFVTLNNTVAKLAERLSNTDGKHAFSFTPEADTVAQKWRSAMSDFSVMLRQSYDGSKFDREAKSVDAVSVHIKHLLWNVTMCGTPDALYRVVNNYTDGFQSRIAVARTPDNTFAPLDDKPPVMTDRQRQRIQQIAHLLPLMQGDVVLPKLEAKGRQWLERIRLESMKNDDRTRARQRIRICVTAQRMTCCLMLCKVCETLIQKHGMSGAETMLKQSPNLWKEMLLKTQTPTMLDAYDVIADSLLENALYFFRDRIENAFKSRNYAGQSGERQKRGRNDTIYERLDVQFTYEQAMQHTVAVKGAEVTTNTVRQMLKNWRKQGLVVQEKDGRYRKV